MAVTPSGAAGAVDSRRRDQQVWRTLGAVAAAIGLVTAVRGALMFVGDPDAPQRALAFVYDLVGADATATQLRELGLNPVSRRAMIVVVALLVGTVGTWLLFRVANTLVEQLSARWRERVLPWVFVGPAMALLGLYLVFPTIGTIWMSLTEDGGGVANYTFAVTDPAMRIAFRNNVLWLVVGTGFSVVIGLVFAALVDRVRREAFAKTFIFLPMAISMVGASVIWKFVYAWQPEGQPQIGMVNAVVTATGADPVPWMQQTPLNTFALIAIMVWLQAGFAMVILSAAIKGVDGEVLEAARIDGANEVQAFWHVVLPSIRGSMITVATTVFIAILKVFDIVFVMTGGRFETEVVANRMFTEMFRFRNFGRASALAVVLLVAVVPIMVLNVRNLRRQGIDA